jgi:predicted phosphodiesterase
MIRMCAFLRALVLVGLAAVPVAAQSFDREPYTGAPTATSVTISWLSSESASAYVEYGEETTNMDTQAFPCVAGPAAQAPDNTTHLVLEGLSPATRYAYRVLLTAGSEEVRSETGHFATEPRPGSPVSFVVLSDTQQQQEGIDRLRLVANAVASDPLTLDFILHAGDLVEAPSDFYWDDWFSSFAHVLLRAPFLPVLGNHEKNDRSYYDAFELPPGGGTDGKRWWALTWGDVVVVGLDTNANKPDEIREQQAWALEHLSGSQTHKFVVLHHPLFASDAAHETDQYVFDTLYHPIFAETGVDIVFSGHSHFYERIVRDGVTYLVVGGGGATPQPIAEQTVPGSVASASGHEFYIRVTTSQAGIAVDCVSVAEETPAGPELTPGLLLDSFFLPVTQ